MFDLILVGLVVFSPPCMTLLQDFSAGGSRSIKGCRFNRQVCADSIEEFLTVNVFLCG